MNRNDPASLQNLNDIVLPDAVGWWPLAPGWYFVAALLAAALLLLSYHRLRTWRNNRYRRAAVEELAVLAACLHDPKNRDSGLKSLPVLIKRVALSAYPREEVAMLSGEDWYDFLDATAGRNVFSPDLREAFSQAAYQPGSLGKVGQETASALIQACEYWVRHHLPVNSAQYQEKA